MDVLEFCDVGEGQFNINYRIELGCVVQNIIFDFRENADYACKDCKDNQKNRDEGKYKAERAGGGAFPKIVYVLYNKNIEDILMI